MPDRDSSQKPSKCSAEAPAGSTSSIFHLLNFASAVFPSVEMKGQIAIWNPYVKVNNYSFYFYCWCRLGDNFLITQDESLRGSVVCPYLSVKKKGDNNLSGLVKEQHFPEARGPSSSRSNDFSGACEQRSQESGLTNLCFRLPCFAG